MTEYQNDIPAQSSSYGYAQTNMMQIKLNWKLTKAEVKDVSGPTETLLYDVEYHLRKPNIIIKPAGSTAPIATGVFHTFSSKIDLTVHGQALELKPTSRLTQNKIVYQSPAFGRELMWKISYSGKSVDMVCLDNENLTPIAKISFAYWSSGQKATFEIMGDASSTQGRRDEVVAGGVTMVQLLIQRTLSAAS